MSELFGIDNSRAAPQWKTNCPRRPHASEVTAARRPPAWTSEPQPVNKPQGEQPFLHNYRHLISSTSTTTIIYGYHLLLFVSLLSTTLLISTATVYYYHHCLLPRSTTILLPASTANQLPLSTTVYHYHHCTVYRYHHCTIYSQHLFHFCVCETLISVNQDAVDVGSEVPETDSEGPETDSEVPDSDVGDSDISNSSQMEKDVSEDDDVILNYDHPTTSNNVQDNEVLPGQLGNTTSPTKRKNEGRFSKKARQCGRSYVNNRGKINTSVVFYKQQLWISNVGIHTCNDGKGYMMWTEGEAKKGSVEICSIHEFLMMVDVGNFEKIVTFSDCCGGQNRNKAVICYLPNNFLGTQLLTVRIFLSA
ncbi:hypothetical protein FHG87_006561 [Trinorchestia longiramus]|nr:hypothetical protein FHG87_006561 [Trinorchestia longiramus]